MAFLIRLAKQQALRSKPAQFHLHIRSLQTKSRLTRPIQIEWIRGSRRTAAIVDAPPSSDGMFNLDCRLSMRATMFLNADTKSERFLSKSSKIVFKMLEDDRFQSLGEIQLDLSACCTGEPIHLELALKNCKDKQAVVDFVIVGHDPSSNSNEIQSQFESVSVALSENDDEAPRKEVNETSPDPALTLERANSPDPAAIINGHTAIERESPKLPRLTPTEEYLSIQLESTKTKLNEALSEITCLRSTAHELQESKAELSQLKYEMKQLKEEMQAEKETMSVSLSYKDRYEDCVVECQRLIHILNETNGSLSQERAIIRNISRLVADIGRRIDQDCEIDVKRLDESYTGCDIVIEDLQMIVDRIFQLRCEVKERQSQVERIGQQQQQVVDKWKALAGKIVKVTADGDVEEIDLRRLSRGKRRSSLILPNRNNEPNSESAKITAESSFDMFRLEIQHLKQELEAERSQYRKANLPPSDTVELEEQLLEAKVRLANLAEALTALEQENKHLKEHMVHSDWSFGFNKSVKHH